MQSQWIFMIFHNGIMFMIYCFESGYIDTAGGNQIGNGNNKNLEKS